MASGGVAVVQNDYDIDEERVSIPFGDTVLEPQDLRVLLILAGHDLNADRPKTAPPTPTAQ